MYECEVLQLLFEDFHLMAEFHGFTSTEYSLSHKTACTTLFEPALVHNYSGTPEERPRQTVGVLIKEEAGNTRSSEESQEIQCRFEKFFT